jgi:hypothetical protein
VEQVVGQPVSANELELTVEPVAAAYELAPNDTAVAQRLLLLNILLQLFDGIATYAGLQLGIDEGNPLLRSAILTWGVAPGLLVFKAEACALLLIVYRIAGDELRRPAFSLLAGVYSVCSLIPWLATFVALFMHYI